jgi:predicted NodU family carbamoyl transferase
MNLILTLGHNSSAIGVKDDQVVGYEEERLTRIKSSSAFPRNAIDMVLRHLAPEANNQIFISHWFDNFDFFTEKRDFVIQRYYDWNFIENLKAKGFTTIHGLSPQLTHHDAHAYSVISFFQAHATEMMLAIDSWKSDDLVHVVVCDGFGSQQEVLSVYEVPLAELLPSYVGQPKPKLVHRVYGYPRSLGLMYQYATSFCGMKEHQDEYKFLGYESHITPEDEKRLTEFAEAISSRMFHANKASPGTPQGAKNFIDSEALSRSKLEFHDLFERATRLCNLDAKRPDLQPKCRIVIGRFVQLVLEKFYERLIEAFMMKHVLLAGGVHYNVKLNNLVAKRVPGLVSIVPLAGDQGAGIGLYTGLGNKFPDWSLLWGRRNLKLVPDVVPKEAVIVNNHDDYVNLILDALTRDQLVNTITGAMEFGPRALCNTSTLALPTATNVQNINELNGRDTVMPFAGVMLRRNLPFFHHLSSDHIVGSLRYMITTLDYRKDADLAQYQGIMHQYPLESRFSGRPQVLELWDKRPITNILAGLSPNVKAVINTSLNVHGRPIVYSVHDAVSDLRENLLAAKNRRSGSPTLKAPILVVGAF